MGPKVGGSSPWGRIDGVEVIADGIVWVSTPSHGGCWLSPARRADMPASLKDVPTWAGPGWYEEDCDWALAALAFPAEFAGEGAAMDLAKETVARWKPEVYAAWQKEQGQ